MTTALTTPMQLFDIAIDYYAVEQTLQTRWSNGVPQLTRKSVRGMSCANWSQDHTQHANCYNGD